MSRKAQVVLTDQQYELVERFSREEQKPISSVLREVIERGLLSELSERRKDQVIKRLFGQGLSVGDWEDMEQQVSNRAECGAEP